MPLRKPTLLATAAENASETFAGTEKAVQGWVDCFPRCALAGTVFAEGVNGAGEIAGHPALEHAYRWARRSELWQSETNGRQRGFGEFAPKFAELNDDVLFGQVWSREDKLSLRDRSIVTVVALMAQGLTDSSFQYHLTTAKNNGVTKTEIAGDPDPCGVLCGLAQGVGGFSYGKGGMGGGRCCRRKSRASE